MTNRNCRGTENNLRKHLNKMHLQRSMASKVTSSLPSSSHSPTNYTQIYMQSRISRRATATKIRS